MTASLLEQAAGSTLPDGLVVVVKEECECCRMVAPLLAELQGAVGVTVYTQDDPAFPAGVDATTTPTWRSAGTTRSRPCRR